jgi:hypothetical protein
MLKKIMLAFLYENKVLLMLIYKTNRCIGPNGAEIFKKPLRSLRNF